MLENGDSSFCFTRRHVGRINEACLSDWLLKVLGTWERFPVLSIFSNVIDLSYILLEVEFAVFVSPVTALAGIFYWVKWDANLID